LANRGATVDYAEYETMAQALSQKSLTYNYKILPITFSNINSAIEKKEVDFIITNPSFYVELEFKFGIMRIATLLDSHDDDYSMPKFGGVLFASSKNSEIRTIEDIKNSQIVAVDENSFGGYVALWYELLYEHDIDISKKVIFTKSHDKVVEQILVESDKVGIVRTDIIERMANKGVLKYDDIRIISPKTYPNFPFFISTKLYPEWAFAALPSTSLEKAEETLIGLLNLNKAESSLLWTIPLDYGKIHEVHKYLKLPPYDIPFSIQDFIQVYYYQIIIGVITLIFILTLLAKLFFINQKYNHININLHKIVNEKTKALSLANEHLKALVDTDELTKIASRRYFFDHGDAYLELCLRRGEELFLLSLDIDHFKKVNDSYGHHIGDKVLRYFCSLVSQCLRKSDIFGRVGGEEFGICAMDITSQGAMSLAEKIRQNIESNPFKEESVCINLSVSIGIAHSNQGDTSIESILNKADKALYRAKEGGRNRIVLWDDLEVYM
jgi:diguanylate cyclase (GGDEF)-like protein